ncbi:MAG TPA: response regulator [Planctomycetaceae bacterium]|nr:response regulator [Planctomycetaceae bacterium]
MQVLLVDDSGTMRAIQKRMFGKLGIGDDNITEASDGREALQFFEATHFDLVLTDWNMPNMDGLTLLKEIRKRNEKVPVIMITTEAERARVVSAISAGVSDYLVKPFTPEALEAKLRRWVPAGIV